ncbi:MAG: hypothetical protein FJ117_16720 [Deltaproteobacteria bacterium]|nr:hypothetical protein [Deltaproteobacteria bacterium]
MIFSYVEKYLKSRGISGPWKISGIGQDGYAGAVVIPALAETDYLFTTLQSLAQNPPELLQRFLIVVVVNHREDASLSDKMDNVQTLRRIAYREASLEHLNLAWVNAASSGRELPVKTGGVGLARKIGFDLALPRLGYQKVGPLFISLDADTLVRPDYLKALIRHFRGAEASGAVIPFCHQPGSTTEEDRAIKRYELFLRAYVLGLSRAGSPYAFHTVGSAMACSAEAYVRAGGMNTRMAGEDFYFLQHLAKTAGISQVKGTVVYPSPRASHRVPFGTGRSITRLLAGDKEAVMFYQTACFQILEEWLALIAQNINASGEEIRLKAERISKDLGDHLDNIHFSEVWDKLRKNFLDQATLLTGFHSWFDGLKTMKLMRHLSVGPLPRLEPDKTLPPLFQWAGLEPVNGIDGQLTLLREMQIGEDYNFNCGK